MRLSSPIAMGLLLSGLLLAQTNAANGAQLQATNRCSDLCLLGPLQVLSDTKGFDFSPYLSRVLRDVKEHWYELITESAGKKRGKVVLQFVIQPDGSVAGLQVVSTSGDVALDRPAYGSITGSNPFPPLPKKFTGPYLGLRFSYYYNMDVVKKPGLSISPVESTIEAGSTVQFRAFENDKGAAVTWSIISCDNTCGAISSAGLYTAPPKIPNPSKVKIKATVILIPNSTAEATVTVVEPKPEVNTTNNH